MKRHALNSLCWIIFLYPSTLSVKLQISTFNTWGQVIANNAIFSKNVNVQKTFLISIVHVCDLLECLTGIPLYMFQLLAGLELNQDSMTLLPQYKTNIDVSTSSLRLGRDFPALWLEDMHEAKEVNMIDALWSLKTHSTLYLGNCLWIKMLLYENWPPFSKGAYMSLHTYVQNIWAGIYTARIHLWCSSLMCH